MNNVHYAIHDESCCAMKLIGFTDEQAYKFGVGDLVEITNLTIYTNRLKEGFEESKVYWEDYAFQAFMQDREAWDMYITGAAGTGKTTKLKEKVQYCIDNEIPYVVCAFTHKACGILRSKLPPGACVRTLHSFLGKRPCINTNATKKEHVNQNVRSQGLDTKSSETDEEPEVLFLDEYSMVGEKDFMDIREAQDSDYDSIPELKVVWIGDPHQLPPVGDMQAIVPSGDYQVTLTKIWRNDNPLQQPLNKLISYMEGKQPEPLEAVPEYFERGHNLIKEYGNCDDDKVLLAYTNKRVETLNTGS